MTVRPIQQVLSIADLKRCAEHLGNHFFEPETMKFFNSRIGNKVYSVTDGIGYFVTSEQHDDHPRHYKVRRFEFIPYLRSGGMRPCERLEVSTWGNDVEQYDTAAQANKAAKAQADAETCCQL